jgi:hypothetical protein
VSTLFLGTCAGFAIATFVNPPLTNKLGNGTVITLGAATQVGVNAPQKEDRSAG